MKKILLSIISVLFIFQVNAQILRIPYSGTDVTVTISGGIYYDNGSPQTDDYIYGVSVLYIRNGGDGSIVTGNIYEGTNYYKPDPDVLHFTSNSDADSLYVYALDWENQGTLHGQYIVNVNGVDYTLTPSNVIYVNSCWSNLYGILEIPYYGTNVTVTISGGIYYDNGSPQTDDYIYGVSVLYVRNGGDGSISTGNIYEGTNYFKPDPDVLQFTSNSNAQSLYVYPLDWKEDTLHQDTLYGQYIVNVNGVDYTLTPSDVVYHSPCYWNYAVGINDLNSSFINNLLKQNYPNPSYHSTTICYFTKYSDFVQLDVFDVLGNKIKNLVNEKMTAGEHCVIWNGEDNNGLSVPAGIYFYQIRTGDWFQAKTMILLK